MRISDSYCCWVERVNDDKLCLMKVLLNSALFVQKLEEYKLRELNRCQTVSYPVICAKENFVVVSPPETGKTAGYVAPLASSLLDIDYYQKVCQSFSIRLISLSFFSFFFGMSAWVLKPPRHCNTLRSFILAYLLWKGWPERME